MEKNIHESKGLLQQKGNDGNSGATESEEAGLFMKQILNSF